MRDPAEPGPDPLRWQMKEGDKAIREILHLLETESSGQASTVTTLHHAILCASLLCLLLLAAIVIVHRKYLRTSSASSSPTTASTPAGSAGGHRDTVITINDEDDVNIDIVCDKDDLTNTTNV